MVTFDVAMRAVRALARAAVAASAIAAIAPAFAKTSAESAEEYPPNKRRASPAARARRTTSRPASPDRRRPPTLRPRGRRPTPTRISPSRPRPDRRPHQRPVRQLLHLQLRPERRKPGHAECPRNPAGDPDSSDAGLEPDHPHRHSRRLDAGPLSGPKRAGRRCADGLLRFSRADEKSKRLYGGRGADRADSGDHQLRPRRRFDRRRRWRLSCGDRL